MWAERPEDELDLDGKLQMPHREQTWRIKKLNDEIEKFIKNNKFVVLEETRMVFQVNLKNTTAKNRV